MSPAPVHSCRASELFRLPSANNLGKYPIRVGIHHSREISARVLLTLYQAKTIILNQDLALLIKGTNCFFERSLAHGK